MANVIAEIKDAFVTSSLSDNVLRWEDESSIPWWLNDNPFHALADMTMSSPVTDRQPVSAVHWVVAAKSPQLLNPFEGSVIVLTRL